jgi:hypothetical protein
VDLRLRVRIQVLEGSDRPAAAELSTA